MPIDSTTARTRSTSPKVYVTPLPRAASARARQRRRWYLRTFLLLVLSGIVLVVLSFWKRDDRVVALLIQQMQPAAQELQSSLDSTGALPDSPEKLQKLQAHYLDYAERFYAQRADRPVIIAYRPASYPEDLYVHANGRTVLILDDDHIHVEWMDEGTLQRRLKLQAQQMRAFEKKLLEKPLNLPDELP